MSKSNSRVVRPCYSPPTLIVRQVATGLAFKLSTGWSFGRRWFRSLNRLFRVVAGAKGAGCFGFEPHPVLEVTQRCNMKCTHCDVRGGEYHEDPKLEDVFRMIDSIATVPEFRMLALTGGDPLMREDIYDIIGYARGLGFEVTVATNSTLVTESAAKKLRSVGATGVAVSLDFIEPEFHDKFRGVPGTWDRTMEGIKNAVDAGLYLQVNITMSKLNLHELPQLLRLADQLGAHVVLLYQFQPFGRGGAMKDIALNSSEFLKVIETVASLQKELETLVVPVGLPEYFAYISNRGAGALGKMFKGCIAGRGMFYVKWYGDVLPCVFLQVVVGNVLKEPAIDIWEGGLMAKLKDRGNLIGPCKSCPYILNCGGCRSRAYLLTGNPLESDSVCPFISKNEICTDGIYFRC